MSSEGIPIGLLINNNLHHGLLLPFGNRMLQRRKLAVVDINVALIFWIGALQRCS